MKYVIIPLLMFTVLMAFTPGKSRTYCSVSASIGQNAFCLETRGLFQPPACASPLVIGVIWVPSCHQNSKNQK